MYYKYSELRKYYIFNQVDDDLRQKAKQLCYGILYGMGNRTLSLHLEVSEMEAAVFMDTFYKTYPAIKVFTHKVLEQCRKRGYVETLKKRRRYLPDINCSIVSRKSEYSVIILVYLLK